MRVLYVFSWTWSEIWTQWIERRQRTSEKTENLDTLKDILNLNCVKVEQVRWPSCTLTEAHSPTNLHAGSHAISGLRARWLTGPAVLHCALKPQRGFGLWLRLERLTGGDYMWPAVEDTCTCGWSESFFCGSICGPTVWSACYRSLRAMMSNCRLDEESWWVIFVRSNGGLNPSRHTEVHWGLHESVWNTVHKMSCFVAQHFKRLSLITKRYKKSKVLFVDSLLGGKSNKAQFFASGRNHVHSTRLVGVWTKRRAWRRTWIFFSELFFPSHVQDKEADIWWRKLYIYKNTRTQMKCSNRLKISTLRSFIAGMLCDESMLTLLRRTQRMESFWESSIDWCCSCSTSI